MEELKDRYEIIEEAATDAIGRHIDRIYATTVEILTDEPKPKKSA